MKRLPTLVLASQSPRRLNLLTSWGLKVKVYPSHAEEIHPQAIDIEQDIVVNARLKGQEVWARRQDIDINPPYILVAADTLVVQGDRVFGKPRDLQEAHQFIEMLGGRPHQVWTGVFLKASGSGEERTAAVRTDVTLKCLNDMERQALFSAVNPLDKAAGYGYQDSPWIVQAIQGSKTNVFGLPMSTVLHLIHQLSSVAC